MAKERKPWVAWVPAMILSVLIIGVFATAFILVGNGLGAPAPKPTQGQVTDLNWSSFTEEGLQYIAASREIRVDFSDKGEDAVTLGLPADGETVIPPNEQGLDYSFIFKGGGEGPGGEKLFATELTIITAGNEVVEIVAPLSEVLNFRETVNELGRYADQYGWDMSGLPELYAQVEQATKDGVPYEFTFGPADRIGVPVAAVGQCDPSGFCLTTYRVGPAVQ